MQKSGHTVEATWDSQHLKLMCNTTRFSVYYRHGEEVQICRLIGKYKKMIGSVNTSVPYVQNNEQKTELLVNCLIAFKFHIDV